MCEGSPSGGRFQMASKIEARGVGKPGVLRAAPESVALGNGTNNVSTPSVAHGAPERPAERL